MDVGEVAPPGSFRRICPGNNSDAKLICELRHPVYPQFAWRWTLSVKPWIIRISAWIVYGGVKRIVEDCAALSHTLKQLDHRGRIDRRDAFPIKLATKLFRQGLIDQKVTV